MSLTTACYYKSFHLNDKSRCPLNRVFFVLEISIQHAIDIINKYVYFMKYTIGDSCHSKQWKK